MSVYTIFLIQDSEGIIIDGSFSDWDNTPMVTDPADGQPSSTIDITSAAIEEGDEYLYFYVSTREDMFVGTGSDGTVMRIFMDADADASTGYSIQNIGADYLIEIYGIQNEIFSSNYYEYYPQHRNDQDEPRSQHDWSAWAPMFRVRSDVDGNQMEAKLWNDELRIPETVEPLILIQMVDVNDNHDFSPVFSRDGAIITEVKANPEIEYLTPGNTHELLDVTISNAGDSNVLIDGITFKQTSTITTDEIASVELQIEDTVISGSMNEDSFTFTGLGERVKSPLSYTFRISLKDSAQIGHALSIQLDSITTSAGVSVDTKTISAYINKAPDIPVIDGLFGDWVNPVTDDVDDVEEFDNENIDLTAYDARNHDVSTYYYMRVMGRMLEGKSIPTNRAMNQPNEDDVDSVGNQDDTPLPVETGEDSIYIFLDTNPLTGYKPGMPFGADYMIKITGQSGVIHSSEYYAFDGLNPYEWNWNFIKSIDSASSGNEIETTVDEEPLNSYFHIVDWEGNEDESSNTIGIDGVNPSGSRTIIPTGTASGEEHGYAVATGDFNNDGDLDLIVGAPGLNSNRGAVYIYYGSGTTMDTTKDISIFGDSTGMRFGSSIAVGNFDGTGGDDFVAGAPSYSSTTGRAFIFHNGGTTGDYASEADVTLIPTFTQSLFGTSLLAGDFDGGGDLDDIAVGSPKYQNDDRGRVTIFYDGSNGSPDVTIDGSAGDRSGTSLAKGDFDNAGDADDLVIGCPTYSTDKGRYKIYADAGTTLTSSLASGHKENIGQSLAVGDFDDDGYTDDVLVGAPLYNSNRGRAIIFFDGTGVYTAPDEDFSPETAINMYFGWSVAVGDFYGDGTDDAIIGAYGVSGNRGGVYVYYGEDTNMDAEPADQVETGSQSSQKLGWSVAAGEVIDNSWNGDDLIAGAPGWQSSRGEVIIYENEDDLGIPEFHALIVPTISVVGLFALLRRRRK